MNRMRQTLLTALTAAVACFLLIPTAAADQVILDDLIVDGSVCAGFDCVNGESFGFDTLRLKENNLRIRFQDTSNSASFPTNDWQLTANDSSNGGANKFSIDDIDGGRTPFTIEANAPSHSLYVDDGGRLGLSTSTPVVELHIVDGDTPTLRLEQDGSSGLTPQTWDVAGNETNFFIRDATNGSKLPFRIRPTADSNSIFVDTSANDSNVGIGTASPSASLHVRRTNGTAKFFVEEASGTEAIREVFELKNNGRPDFAFENTATGDRWVVQAANTMFFQFPGNPGNEMELTSTGNVTIAGSINTTDCAPCVSDYVFEPDYKLMPLSQLADFVKREKHLPNVPSQGDVDKAGKLNMTQMQMRLLEKVEELALYTIQQQETIDELQARLTALEPVEQDQE